MTVRRMSSWLGLSAAVGLGLALAVSAFARETGPVGARQFAAVPSDSPSPAPLAVFSKPHSARDALPAELVERAASLAGGSELPDAVRNGTLDLANAKLLLADVGSTHSNLYAFPTSKGRVCYMLTAGPEGCFCFHARDSRRDFDVRRRRIQHRDSHNDCRSRPKQHHWR